MFHVKQKENIRNLQSTKKRYMFTQIIANQELETTVNMPKIFTKNAKFNVVVYGEQCTESSWQEMMKACFGIVKKVLKVS